MKLQVFPSIVSPFDHNNSRFLCTERQKNGSCVRNRYYYIFLYDSGHMLRFGIQQVSRCSNCCKIIQSDLNLLLALLDIFFYFLVPPVILPISFVIPVTLSRISLIELSTIADSFLTSLATISNPRPNSPACAASMAAFNASNCV